MEPSTGQMLLTNAVQTTWPANRQIALAPSWQQLSAHQGAIQQPLLSETGDWGRSLIVDSSALLQVSIHFMKVAITLNNILYSFYWHCSLLSI